MCSACDASRFSDSPNRFPVSLLGCLGLNVRPPRNLELIARKSPIKASPADPRGFSCQSTIHGTWPDSKKKKTQIWGSNPRDRHVPEYVFCLRGAGPSPGSGGSFYLIFYLWFKAFNSRIFVFFFIYIFLYIFFIIKTKWSTVSSGN